MFPGLLVNAGFSSFQVALIAVMKATTGPVLECGTGFYSTPMLHWWARLEHRHVTSYEGNPAYYEFSKNFQSEWHDVTLVSDWDRIEVGRLWSVVLIDHEPARRRIEFARVRHAEYVVFHDAEHERAFRLKRLYRLYKYGRVFSDLGTDTMVFSNFRDPIELM